MANKEIPYSWKLMTGYEYELKKALCLAIDFNDINALEKAHEAAKKLIQGETRGRPTDKANSATRKEINAHICGVLASRDTMSFTKAWEKHFGGTGQPRKPQCTPHESARHLIGYSAIDEKTERAVRAKKLDLKAYLLDAE